MLIAFAGTAEDQDNRTRMMKENVAGVWAPLMIFVPTKFAFKKPSFKKNKKTGGTKKKTDVPEEGAGDQGENKTDFNEEPH